MLTYQQIEDLDADALFEIERKSVGPGWQAIIEKCHKVLRESSPDYKPIQIKEKFGGLRYYVQGVEFGTPAYNPITEAEETAEATCEECGQPGENKSVKGWWRTLCESDRTKMIQQRESAS